MPQGINHPSLPAKKKKSGRQGLAAWEQNTLFKEVFDLAFFVEVLS